MANQQEFESIDELFRKTFSDLPESPAVNGWDTPSDKVWQQVQNGIQTRHTTWTWSRKIMALAAISVVVATGAYYLSRNTAAVVPAPATPAVEMPVTTPAVTVETAKVTSTTAAPLVKQRTATPQVSKSDLSLNTPHKIVAAPAVAHVPSAPMAAPPVKTVEQSVEVSTPQRTAPKPPNSVEKRRLMEQMKGAWKTPLNTIPSAKGLEPQIPASIRRVKPE